MDRQDSNSQQARRRQGREQQPDEMASLSVPAEAAAAAPGLAGAGEVSGTRETSTFVADEEHVNDYVVVKELGRGTFASVFKVRDRRDGQLYVRRVESGTWCGPRSGR